MPGIPSYTQELLELATVRHNGIIGFILKIGSEQFATLRSRRQSCLGCMIYSATEQDYNTTLRYIHRNNRNIATNASATDPFD